jgi:hypothetical protein
VPCDRKLNPAEDITEIEQVLQDVEARFKG